MASSRITKRNQIEQLRLKEFSRRLAEAIDAKGWCISDLARAVWGERIDSRGYPVAKSRDRAGQFLAGKSFPTAKNLAKIAEALDTTPEKLSPPITITTDEEPESGISLTAITGDPDNVLLQINRPVPKDIAIQAITLINGQ